MGGGYSFFLDIILCRVEGTRCAGENHKQRAILHEKNVIEKLKVV